MDEFLAKNIGLVKHLAKKLFRYNRDVVQFEELEQEIMIGMWKSLQKWEEGKGTTLESFVGTCGYRRAVDLIEKRVTSKKRYCVLPKVVTNREENIPIIDTYASKYDDFYEAIESLTEKQKLVIKMTLEGKKRLFEEMNCSRQNVRIIKKKAIKKLKEKLGTFIREE